MEHSRRLAKSYLIPFKNDNVYLRYSFAHKFMCHSILLPFAHILPVYGDHLIYTKEVNQVGA